MVGPPNYHDLNTKISTNDYWETGRGASEKCDNLFTIIWKKCRFWSVKNDLFSCWIREKLPFFSTFVREKGFLFNQKSGKIILGNCWEPCISWWVVTMYWCYISIRNNYFFIFPNSLQSDVLVQRFEVILWQNNWIYTLLSYA